MKVLFVTAILSAHLSAWLLVLAHIEFTNLKCSSLDKTFVDFEYCLLKSVNRSYKYLSLKVNLFQVPITKATGRFAFLKRANGFKPFLYNITFDACRFIRARKSNKVIDFFYSSFEHYSNLNHTCPYDHDIIIEKVPISHVNHLFGRLLPIPEGEYQLDLLWSAYNIPRVNIKIKFKKSDWDF